MLEPNHRRKLNNGQIEVLELLHKFRFGSSELIAQYFGKKNGAFAYNRLQRLLQQGYIGKRFDSSYRIQGKPAAYFLLPDGARVLQSRQKSDDDPINIKTIYRDKTVQETFIERCLDIFAIYNRLKNIYGNPLSFFTKVNLNHDSYSYFPDPPPDAFLVLETKDGDEKEFLLDFFGSNDPFFVAVRKIEQYIKYAKGNTWTEQTEFPMPVILFICDPSMQKRLQKRISSALRKNRGVDMTFAFCTKADLLGGESAVWRKADDPDKLLSLYEI